ncbi:MAG: hypothetical protein ACXWK6_10880, partial [Myxococcaceae bacterium]
MHRLVFTTLLGVSLAASAHDGKDDCADEHAKAAGRPSGPATLKPGVVLVRGEPLPKNQQPVALASVLGKPEDGRTVLVEGVVRRACSQMGCWMELAPAEGGPGVRVTF